jgi:glycosyltransferase involved in cell wall biosynthesis
VNQTIYINASTAHVGGAVTYINGLVRALAKRARDHKYIVFANPELTARFEVAEHVDFVTVFGDGRRPPFVARLLWDQLGLRRSLTHRPAVLFAAANVALFRSPVPQVLLLRQSLYFSRDFRERILPARSLRSRAEERTRFEYLKRSIDAADHLLVPSQSMKDALTATLRVGMPISVLPYATVADPLRHVTRRDRPFTFVYPSHYADYKNFRHLLEGAKRLRQRGYKFRLRLNAEPEGFPSYVSAWHSGDCQLFADPALASVLERVGPQTADGVRRSLDDADALVMPSFTESFGHPFLEAMRVGLPIAASDRPIAHEIAGDASVFFDPWSPDSIADAMASLIDDRALVERLGAAGLSRVAQRTWADYVDDLERVCASH